MIELFQMARAFSQEEGTAFLFSGGSQECAKRSFLFLFPFEKVTCTQDHLWDPLQALDLSSPYSDWVGFLSYEMGAFATHSSFSLPEEPLALFYRYGLVIQYEHATGKITLFSNPTHVPSRFRDLPSLLEMSASLKTEGKCILKGCSETQESYEEKVERAKEAILEGEIYQLNLSIEYLFEADLDPFHVFEKISALNPAPFSAYLKTQELTIVSSSPERLLKKERGILETRPIKGTAPRGKTREEDARNLLNLQTSEKERAELLMIVDLMRNDLTKISEPMSVKVKQLYKYETYKNVFHQMAHLESRANSALSSVSQLQSIFPGGSITGCPKRRAMEYIHTLEGRSRGLYTGSIGYLGQESFDFNIAIRTLVFMDNKIKTAFGSGIVVDSNKQSEYQETLHKAESLFKVLGL